MHIIRFESDDNKIYTGCEYKDGQANIIQGDIYTRFKKTRVKKIVKKLLTPIMPTVIYCIGFNFMPHIKETGFKLPEYPILFMKNLGAAAAHLDDIKIPASCENPPQVDYEAELAVVIKNKIKNVSVDKALDSVLGYTCANDISARIWQMHGGGKQWVRGKSFDTFCPFGPWIVTSDELKNPDDLEIECVLNGKTMQKGNTRDMIFSVAQLISFLSESTTLFPGTLILTGTPSGVGFTRQPPVFLAPGDILETKIKGIGQIKNLVVPEKEQ
ncbi:MAG: fumarylacetoacetate hydrolase family protein [Pseudomonadota bacterium]